MFGIGSQSKIGVDIGTASIKVVELDKKGNRLVLKNYGLLELKSVSSASPLEKSILKLPDDEIAWGISEVIKKSKISSRVTVASIPAFSTFAMVIEMPYLSEAELAKAIPIEARKYIPIPIEEVILDWSIIGVAGGGTKPTVEVFLAVVPRNETLRYQNIMAKAGLTLKALELENSSLIRAVLGNDLTPTAIVNIGGRSTSIMIINKGYERLSHNYEVGGFEITKTISRSLNISLEKAEDLKKRLGFDKSEDNIVQQAMYALVDMMAAETKRTIISYETSQNVKIARVLLVGGMVNMPNFLPYMQEKLGRELFIGNPFSRIIYPPALNPEIQELASTFAVAAGLAMREI